MKGTSQSGRLSMMQSPAGNQLQHVLLAVLAITFIGLIPAPAQSTETHPFFKIPASQISQTTGFQPLFNGVDLKEWVDVNCAPETWTVRDGVIHCTGFPTGALRTRRQYENFILESGVPVVGLAGTKIAIEWANSYLRNLP